MSRGVVWGGVIALLALWALADFFLSDSLVVAGPIEIAGYVGENFPILLRAVVETSKNAAWGFAFGTLAAVFLAAMGVLWRRSEAVLSAVALVVFCLPLIATGPIFRVLFGPGAGPQITLAALACYFTTYLALRVGLRAVPQAWDDLIRIYGRGAWTHLIRIRARASLPYLVAGLQIGAPAAFLGAMIGEFTGAERGLGVLTLRAMQGLRPEATWAIGLIAAGLSILAYGVIGAIGTKLVGYRAEILLAPPRPVARVSLWRPVILVLGVAAGVIGLWYVAMEAFALNRFFAKRPGDIWVYLVTDPGAEGARDRLFAALAETLTLTVPGYFAGLIMGAGLAIGLQLLPMARGFVLPLAVTLRSVPIITTAPLIVLALGRGALGTIVIVAVMIFFPTFVACAQGLRQVPGQISDVFDSYRVPPLRRVMLAQVPAMLPAFFASARMAVPAAVLAATTTEWLATGRGIGVLMALTTTTSDYNMLWSCVVVVCLVAVAGYAIVAFIEQRVLRVYAPEQVI